MEVYTMLELEEAVSLLKSVIKPIEESERIPLSRAAGRVLAEEIRAVHDQPPFPRSPLDGYAVRGKDTLHASKKQPVCLKEIGKIYAGEVFTGSVKEGECVRLMTGAPIPSGADTVIRQEDTDYSSGQEAGQVRIYRESVPYQNYCYAGEDYRKGDLLLKAGDLLNGARIGLAAAAGREGIEVYREPAITVISTGDELISPGEKLMPGKIYDANRFVLLGRLQDLGLKNVESYHCKDEPDTVSALIRKAARDSDLIVTTGGVSVGEKDIMHEVMADLQGDKLFWRVNLKPGAPTLAFMTGENAVPVICLTGNPYGVAVNFELLVRPVLEKLCRNPSMGSLCFRARLTGDSPKHGGVRRYMRGHYDMSTSEVTLLTGSHASGTLSTMAEADCLAEIPKEGGFRAGDSVRVFLL